MERHEKEFGWLWKNVGEHFPSLLHGLYINHNFKDFNSNEIFNIGIFINNQFDYYFFCNQMRNKSKYFSISYKLGGFVILFFKIKN